MQEKFSEENRDKPKQIGLMAVTISFFNNLPERKRYTKIFLTQLQYFCCMYKQ